MSEIEWAPWNKSLLWNAKDPVAKLAIYITTGISLWELMKADFL